MKYIFLVLAFAFNSFLVSCQQTPEQQAKKQMEDIGQMTKKYSPGFTATSENGYYMKAKIDGKQWMAAAMLPNDKSESRRIQGENNGVSIGFYVWTPHLQAGRKMLFKEGHAADLITTGDPGIWGGEKGELIITKYDGESLEGNFHFTGTSFQTNKSIEVTDGYFRLPLSVQ